MADAYPELATDPSDEELARDWTITESDRVEVRLCRGDGNRHRFAVQLCALRALGRFVDDFAAAPVRIVNHVGRQLGLAPSLFIEPPDRRATTADHAQRIREYLGHEPFDDARLKGWLADRATEGVPSASLLALAVSTLRAWKMEIPGRSTLERLTGSAGARGDEAAWQRVHERLSPEFCDAIDRLLAVADGGRHSGLFQFKQYPPDPRPADILTYLERLDLLRSIGAAGVDLAGIPSNVLERLAELGRRYDAKELRRFSPSKRYALVACFLADAQKTTLDHLVEMHREYLTGFRQ